MGYYHPSQPQVILSWADVQKSVFAYLDCAQSWYDNHPTSKSAPSDQEVLIACKGEDEALKKHLQDLTGSLESARRYAWTGWDSPQELKRLLQGSSQ